MTRWSLFASVGGEPCALGRSKKGHLSVPAPRSAQPLVRVFMIDNRTRTVTNQQHSLGSRPL